MKKKFIFIVVILSMMSLPLCAQGTGDITNTGSNGGAINSANENQAIVNVNDNSTKNYSSAPYLLNTYPGTGSVPAGYYFERGEWWPYFPEVSNFRKMSREQILLAKGRGGGKVKGTIYKKINCAQKPEFIQLTNYPIRAHAEPGDEVIAVAMVEGKFGWTREQYLVAAYAWSLDNKICSDRASVLAMDLAEGVTRGLSFGPGATGAASLGDGGMGSAVGAMIGKNRTRREVKPMFEVAFLNRGPFLVEVKKDDNNGNGSKKNVLIPPKDDSSMLGYLKKMSEDFAEIAKNLSKPAVININNIPAVNLPPLPPASQPVAQGDVCAGMPKLEAYFEKDKDVIAPQYFPGIKTFAEWKKATPQCKVQTQGHTCALGSATHNNDLSSRRSKALSNKLKEYGAEVEEFAAFGKNKPKPSGSEFQKENRRAFVRIIGAASGE